MIACVAGACLIGAGRLDDAVAVFDFQADANHAATFTERTYPVIDSMPGGVKVIEDARLWMPEDETYRVVFGQPSLERRHVNVPYFLFLLLSPRSQAQPQVESAPWVFCYGCTPATLGSRVRGSLGLGARPSVRAEETRDRPGPILGLLVLNVFILAVGAGVLWGIRGWRWWTDFARLAGVAYLLGVSALMIVMTFEIVVGIPIGALTILLTGAGIVLLGGVVGRRRGFTAPALRPPGWRFPGISLFAALFAAGIVVYFEGLFRAQRLAGVGREWDSWANWLPKSRELYASGRLEPDFLLQITSQSPGYPPGPATIQAAAFHAMGSADTVTLAPPVLVPRGRLRPRGDRPPREARARRDPLPGAPAFLVAPTVVNWITTVYADLPLSYLVAVAALLLILWIEEAKPWHLAAATVLLAGGMLTKREGIAFAACVLLAALVASFTDRRRLWRPLVAAGLIAFALVLPWRIWFTAHGLPGDGPELGYIGAFSHLDAVWPALKLNVETLFDADLWRYAPFLAGVAIVLAGLARAWKVVSVRRSLRRRGGRGR